VFRKRLAPEKPAIVDRATKPALPASTTLFAKHLHIHRHENPRVFPRRAIDESLVYVTRREERSTTSKLLQRQATDHFTFTTRELRTVDTILRHRIDRDRELINTRLRGLSRATTEVSPTSEHRHSGSTNDTAPTSRLAHRASLRSLYTLEAKRQEVRRLEIAAAGGSESATSLIRHRAAPLAREEAAHGSNIRARLTHPRAVEQVWRTQNTGNESIPGVLVKQERFVHTPQSPTTPPIPGLGPVLSSAASSSMRRFEGPEIDRLADDVLKRIERHVRIERERRGM
jgi:hypothetical protein